MGWQVLVISGVCGYLNESVGSGPNTHGARNISCFGSTEMNQHGETPKIMIGLPTWFWDLNVKCPPPKAHVFEHWSQLVALCWEVVDLLGDGATLEEVSH